MAALAPTQGVNAVARWPFPITERHCPAGYGITEPTGEFIFLYKGNVSSY